MSKDEVDKAYGALGLKPDANYYEILGVDQKASHDEIRKKYKKLSLKYHPDKYKENDEVFKLIGEVGKTLGDEDNRRQYDLTLADKTQAQTQAQAAEVSAVDLEAVLKQSKEISREEVQEFIRTKLPTESRMSIDDLDKAIEAKKASIVIPEISERIIDSSKEDNGKITENRERIGDMLAYAPEYRTQIEKVVIEGISAEIKNSIKQGSGYIIDSSKSWEQVENMLSSMPEQYRVEIVSKALDGIDNTSRRDRLLDMLPESQRELAMADVKPTAWQAIREAAALMRGDAGFEYDSAPVIAKATDKGKGR